MTSDLDDDDRLPAEWLEAFEKAKSEPVVVPPFDPDRSRSIPACIMRRAVRHAEHQRRHRGR